MKIGNINLSGKIIQGPMAGVSNEAFRLISKEHGAALVCTEMISVEGLLHENQKTKQMLKVNRQEHPVSLQLFGHDPQSFVEAVKIVDQFSDCDIIDLNLGCPVPKIAVKSQSGSQLLRTPELIYEIVASVVATTKKPVTAKIRLGWDKETINAVEVAKIIEKAGAQAITVHARTRSEFYQGYADWEQIKAVKAAVKIPVIGNGDVIDDLTAAELLQTTGCDGVMISRACQGNPWIFEQCNYFLKTKKHLPKPNWETWKMTVQSHAQRLVDLKGESVGIKEFRKHLAWYCELLPKNLESQKIKNASNQLTSLSEIKSLLISYEGKIKNE